MLPVSLDDNEIYEVLSDNRQGFNLVLVHKEMPEGAAVLKPLWVFPCGDQRSLDAASHWCLVRRALWESWGALAEEQGSNALRDHMAELMAQEPIGEVVGTIVQADREPRVLNLGELLMTADGCQKQILYRHRFSTPGKRKRFFDWFGRNMNNGSSERLMDLGTQRGTAAIAASLEQIAAGQIVRLA